MKARFEFLNYCNHSFYGCLRILTMNFIFSTILFSVHSIKNCKNCKQNFFAPNGNYLNSKIQQTDRTIIILSFEFRRLATDLARITESFVCSQTTAAQRVLRWCYSMPSYILSRNKTFQLFEYTLEYYNGEATNELPLSQVCLCVLLNCYTKPDAHALIRREDVTVYNRQ